MKVKVEVKINNTFGDNKTFVTFNSLFFTKQNNTSAILIFNS